jgi:hypothetical protein
MYMNDNFKYSTKGIDPENFILTFDGNLNNLFIQSWNNEETHDDDFQKSMEITCAFKLKRTYPPNGKRSANYWWIEGLKKLRTEVLRKRRVAQKTKNRRKGNAN